MKSIQTRPMLLVISLLAYSICHAGRVIDVTKAVRINPEITFIEEKNGVKLNNMGGDQLPKNAVILKSQSGLFEEGATGFNLYSFVLQPKERLNVTLKSEDSYHVTMKFLPPTMRDGMQSQYRRANGFPPSWQSGKFDITNITDKQYEVILCVRDSANYEFRLDFERKITN